MDTGSMGGGGGGAMGAISGMMSAYSQGVNEQQGQPPPNQQTQLQQFRPNQPGPAMAQPIAAQPAQAQPPADWAGELPGGNGVGISQVRGQAAGNAARASSLQTAISNFHQAQALGNQSPPQSTQAQDAQRQPQQNLAQLSRQLQADTAGESAAQQYQSNPNYQWASQQQVNPANMQDMNSAENYVNQNAYTPPNLLDETRGFND